LKSPFAESVLEDAVLEWFAALGTVKVYRSRREETSDGSWRHVAIRLEPDTDASGYEPIVLDGMARTRSV
jgi:hypothetical protein